MELHRFTLFSLFLSLAFQAGAFAQELPSEAILQPPARDTILQKVPGSEIGIQSSIGQYGLSVNETTREVIGFDLINQGPNRIVPRRGGIGSGPERDFRFSFQDRARQNIILMVTDVPTEYLSHMMESYFYFFPRRILPAIQWDESDPQGPRATVYLPTGESVHFDGRTKEILGGVLEEVSPIDLGPDRFKRKFAQIRYRGKGLMIRVDKRGGDPRLGTVATLTLGGRTCKMSSALLFNQGEHSQVEFLYPTDEEFNEVVNKHCGFGFS
jgi:hypothetical protein